MSNGGSTKTGVERVNEAACAYMKLLGQCSGEVVRRFAGDTQGGGGAEEPISFGARSGFQSWTKFGQLDCWSATGLARISHWLQIQLHTPEVQS